LGEVSSQAVITPLGREILRGLEDRGRIIEGVAERSLVSGIFSLGKGSEGSVRKISDADSLIQWLSGKNLHFAVEKRLNGKPGTKMLGWEIVEMFNYVKPAFQERGFGLVQPLGATDHSVFFQFEKSYDLKWFFDNTSLPKSFREDLRNEIMALEVGLHQCLQKYLGTKGCREVPGLTNDYWPFWTADGGSIVDVILDVGEPFWDYEFVFRNWIVQRGVRKNIQKLFSKGEITEAYDSLKRSLICVDPVLVYRLEGFTKAPLRATG